MASMLMTGIAFANWRMRTMAERSRSELESLSMSSRNSLMFLHTGERDDEEMTVGLIMLPNGAGEHGPQG